MTIVTEKTVDQLIKEMPFEQRGRTRMIYKRGLAEARLAAALELEALYMNTTLTDADITSGLSAWITEVKEAE